jgi:membrane-bound lytic murein transglycosylase F
MKLSTVSGRFLCYLILILAVICTTSCQERKSGRNPVSVFEVTDFDLEDIRERGKLIVVTDYNSTNYFIYRGEPMGYQFELLRELSDYLGIQLEILVENDVKNAFDMLNTGECDLIAFNLTVTKERSRIVSFTVSHSETRQVLVQRKPEEWWNIHPYDMDKMLLRNQLDLAGKTIYVQKNSSYSTRLQTLSDEIGDSIYIVELPEEVENLIELVAKGEIDYTISDENIAKVNLTYYPNLDIQTAISFPQSLAWAVRKNSNNLLIEIDKWMIGFKKTLTYALIYNKYFENQKTATMVQSDLYTLGTGKISPYDVTLKLFSQQIEWDWRLLASLVYQESRFDPRVQSWAGAFGLMQLMPTTAQRYGVTRNSSPEKNIEAGTRFLKWLEEVFSDKVADESERLKFVLAAYNVGVGHILDARQLASKYGKDPELWEDNVEYYLLLKSEPRYYQDPVVKYGYCRGQETSNYVKEILDRYEHYKNILAGF